jgi:uncharacterized protein GlcG (DUF336 family)
MTPWLFLFLLWPALSPTRTAPVLQTQMIDGVARAVAFHTIDGLPVTEQAPAQPGEVLVVMTLGLSEPPSSTPMTVLVGPVRVPGSTTNPRDRRFPHNGLPIAFQVPSNTGGEFTEVSVMEGDLRSNAATLPVALATPDSTQLSADEVDRLVQNAAGALNNEAMVIAVVDRAGHPLAVYRKLQATDRGVEDALAEARTSAFFSSNQAPLNSRTIDSISQEHFPVGIPNQPAGDLFGIQHTNRGCDYHTTFLPNQSVARPLNAAGTGLSEGVATTPGGVPLYRNGTTLIGGIGIGGVPGDAAEFAAVAAASATGLFVQEPLPTPGAVFIGGIRLPFVSQTTQPAGTAPDPAPAGVYQIVPRAGAAPPDGWIVGPKAGQSLSVDDVKSVIANGIATASLTRATIRLPAGVRTAMVFAVADLNGDLLGVYRMADAVFFSIDVAITKSRNVVYFSGPNLVSSDLPGIPFGTAVTNRTIGFGSQPFFPSGIAGTAPGPFQPLYFFDAANPCTQGSQPANPYQSGVVFFPGSAPLYKSGTLAGGMGVSGDGVAEDDYVTAGAVVGFEPPSSIRADQVFIRGVRMPFWTFPRNPLQ